MFSQAQKPGIDKRCRDSYRDKKDIPSSKFVNPSLLPIGSRDSPCRKQSEREKEEEEEGCGGSGDGNNLFC